MIRLRGLIDSSDRHGGDRHRAGTRTPGGVGCTWRRCGARDERWIELKGERG
jgi:hypothetical protein